MVQIHTASTFPVSTQVLWDAVPFGALNEWHPFVPNLTMSNEGRTRTMGFGSMTAVESLTDQGERHYTYIVEKSPMPVADYEATWTVTGTDTEATLTIDASFNPTGDDAEMLLNAFFAAGFKALAAKLV